jgi:transcriptional regulator with XRE-family HTH domain/5-methylcytosine-specific restriction endonuclease McrA
MSVLGGTAVVGPRRGASRAPMPAADAVWQETRFVVYRRFDASRLRRLRHDRGWSLRKLADQAGLHPATLSMIETHQSPCRERSALAIAMALDVPLDELAVSYRLPPRRRRQRRVANVVTSAKSQMEHHRPLAAASVLTDDRQPHRPDRGAEPRPTYDEAAPAAWLSNSPLISGVVVVWQPDRTSSFDRRFVEDRCANCLRPLRNRARSLFCGEGCRQIAETVRYWRRVTRDARIDQPDVQLALRTRLAHLLAGGYPKVTRRLTVEIRRQVVDRDHGRCRNCGAVGTEIDHIHDSSHQLANLQLLCTACHQSKTTGRMVPASTEQRQLIELFQHLRVVPESPALLCDDDHEWAIVERDLRHQRWQRLMAETVHQDDIANPGGDSQNRTSGTRSTTPMITTIQGATDVPVHTIAQNLVKPDYRSNHPVMPR